jgi:hypothetical protein
MRVRARFSEVVRRYVMSRQRLTLFGFSALLAGSLAGTARAQLVPATPTGQQVPPTAFTPGPRFVPQGGWFNPTLFYFFPFRGSGSNAWMAYRFLPAAAVRSVGFFPFGSTNVVPDFRLGTVTVTHAGPNTFYNWQPYPWTDSYPISAQDAAMWDATYDVGTVAQQQAMLDRLWSTVVVRVQPSDATVQIDDHVVGTASRFAAARASMRIPPGRYRFEATRPGYESYSTVVALQPGEKFVLARKLARTR